MVATIFGIHSEQYGEGVVHIATRADLAGVTIGEGNVLREQEIEVAIHLTPSEFADRASITITSSQARSLLESMGVSVRSGLFNPGDISNELANTPRLAQDQIAQFLDIARGL